MAGNMTDVTETTPGGAGNDMMSKMRQMSDMMASKADSMPPEKMKQMISYMDEMMNAMNGSNNWMGKK
jgi:hypothetical protein